MVVPADIFSHNGLVKVLSSSLDNFLGDLRKEDHSQRFSNENDDTANEHSDDPRHDSIPNIRSHEGSNVHFSHGFHDEPAVTDEGDSVGNDQDQRNRKQACADILPELFIESFIGLLRVSDVDHALINSAVVGSFLALSFNEFGVALRLVLLVIGGELFGGIAVLLLICKIDTFNHNRGASLGTTTNGGLSNSLVSIVNLVVIISSGVGALLVIFFSLLLLVVRVHLGVDVSLVIWVLGSELLVVSFLNNLSLLEDKDHISVFHCGETMGNHESGDFTAKLLLHLVDRLLNESFVALVESTSGLVKDQHAGFLDKGAGKSDSLLLSTRKLTTTSTNASVEGVLVFAHESPGFGGLKGFGNFFISSIGLSHEEVLLDARVEKNWLLTDVTDLSSVVSQVERLHVEAVDEDLSLTWVVESLKELNASGLA